MSEPLSHAVSRLLRDRKEELVDRWTQHVRAQPDGVHGLSEPELRHAMPLLVDAVATGLAQHAASANADVAREECEQHARTRFSAGYDLGQAIRELSQFRTDLIDLVDESGLVIDAGTSRVIHQTIDEWVTLVADSVHRVDQQEHRASEDSLRKEAVFRERVIGVLGHDLRSPLSAIKALAFMVLRRPLEAENAESVRRITKSAERMARMISDVLDFARARCGGGIPFRPVHCDALAICRDAIDEMKLSYPARAIQLDAMGDGTGNWDPDRLQQVFSNLLTNALEYSPPDTSVRIKLNNVDGALAIEVHNWGPAIPAADLESIFDPFKRAEHELETGRRTHGAGLGLYIVWQIVRAHGGEVSARSSVEQGTTISIRLPRSPPSDRSGT